MKRPVGAAGVSAARQVARIDEGLGSSEQGIFPSFGLNYSLVPLAAGAGVRRDGRKLRARCGRQGERGALSALGDCGGGLDAHRAGGDGRRATTGPAALGACTAAFVVTRASKPGLEPCLVKFGAVQRLW